MIRIVVTKSVQIFAKTLAHEARAGVKAVVNIYIHKLATEVKDHLVDGIKNEQFDVPGPSAAWRLRQQDERSLINKGTYVNAIQVHLDKGKGYRVGFGDERNENGVLLKSVAERLEFGTATMPARPHWRPTELWAKNRVGFFGKKALNHIAIGVSGR